MGGFITKFLTSLSWLRLRLGDERKEIQFVERCYVHQSLHIAYLLLPPPNKRVVQRKTKLLSRLLSSFLSFSDVKVKKNVV